MGRAIGFEFHGHPEARIFARDNVFAASPAASADNRLAVGYRKKLRELPAEQKRAMIAAEPFTELPSGIEPPAQAFATVLAEAGATLPARDAVDFRLVEHVRQGTGRVIGKDGYFIGCPAQSLAVIRR